MRSPPTAAATGLASILPDQPAGSLALAAAVAASATPAQPDAALLDLGRRWRITRQRWDDLGARDAILTIHEYTAEANAIGADERAITTAIAALPAAGLLGLAVKARVLACEADCEVYDDPGIMAWTGEIGSTGPALERAIASLVGDVLRLAQKAGR